MYTQEEKLHKSFLSSTAIYFSQAISILFNFLTTVFVIKYFSLSDYGAYKLAGSLLVIAGYFASFGLENVINRFLPEYRTTRNSLEANKLVLFAVIVRITMIFLFIGLLYAFKVQIFAFLKLPAILAAWLGVICAIIFLNRTSTLFGTALLSAYLEHYVDKINRVLFTIFRFVLFLTAGVLDWGFKGLIFSWLGLEVMSFAYYFVVAARKIMQNTRNIEIGPPNTSHLNYARLGKFGFYSWLATSASIFRDFAIDNFIISRYANIENVALYAFASVLITTVSSLNPTNSLRSVFVPLLVDKYYSIGSRRDMLENVYNILNKVSFFVVVPSFILTFLLAKPIIVYIYSPKYLDSLTVVYTLLPFFFVSTFSYAFNPLINVLEKNELFLIAGIFSIYNLVMDIVLVPRFGMMGAAWATGSAGALSFLYYYLSSKFYLRLRLHFPVKTLLKVSINCVPMALFVGFTRNFIDSIIILVVVGVIGGIMYLLMAYFNSVFTVGERELINRAIGKKLWIF